VSIVSGAQGGNRGRPIGLPKTGGRAKGTPNRSTLALREMLASLGCDLVEELVKIARLPNTSVGSKITIFTALLPYVHPKRKPAVDSERLDDDAPAMTREEMIVCAKGILSHYLSEAQPQGEVSTKTSETQPDSNSARAEP